MLLFSVLYYFKLNIFCFWTVVKRRVRFPQKSTSLKTSSLRHNKMIKCIQVDIWIKDTWKLNWNRLLWVLHFPQQWTIAGAWFVSTSYSRCKKMLMNCSILRPLRLQTYIINRSAFLHTFICNSVDKLNLKQYFVY